MKFLIRWTFRILILLLVVTVGVLLLKDMLVKEVAQTRLRAETGLETRIGKLSLSLLSPTITIQDCVIYNSAEFGGSPFLEIPEIHLEYDRQDLALNRFHLKLLRLNIREINVVENEKGQTNIHGFFERTGLSAPAGKPGADSATPDFKGIDHLNLTVGKVRYTNLRNQKRNQETAVNIQNEIISNLKSKEDFAGVLLKIFLRAGITIDHAPRVAKPVNRI